MANLNPNTSRRSLLGFLAAAPVALAPAALAARAAISENDAFIAALNGLHPNGAKVARLALAAGMKPENMFSVMILRDREDQSEWPALLFTNPEGRNRTFRPTGEVN